MNENEWKALEEIVANSVDTECAVCTPLVGTWEVKFHIDHRALVTVNLPSKQYGEPTPAQVNWAAIGSVDTEVANNFANVIKAAVAVAAALNS